LELEADTKEVVGPRLRLVVVGHEVFSDSNGFISLRSITPSAPAAFAVLAFIQTLPNDHGELCGGDQEQRLFSHARSS
jgi:hypothetical protein